MKGDLRYSLLVLGQSPQKAEAFFLYQRVMLTLRYWGDRQWRFKRAGLCFGRPFHVKRNTIVLLGQNPTSGVLGGASTSAQTSRPLFDTEDYYFEMAKNGRSLL